MLKSKIVYLTLTVLLSVAFLITGCNGNNNENTTETIEITEAGSTTVQPVAEVLANAYMAKYSNVKITIQGGGSSTGVKKAADRTVDIGAASRDLKDSEQSLGLVEFVLAKDGIAIATHPDNPVSDLSTEEVMKIFSGEITKWSEVGGGNNDIVIVSREEGSGTRGAFEEMVMGEEALISDTAILQSSNGAVRTTIAGEKNAIGYLSFGYLDDTVKSLSVDGVVGKVENALDGSYPIVRPLLLLTKGQPTGEVKKFLDYCLSAEGQKLVEDEGYISPLAEISESGSGTDSSTSSGSTTKVEITEAGSTTVQPIAESLAEAFMVNQPHVKITIQGGGSSTGVKKVADGTVDIGAASRELKASEIELGVIPHVIAKDGIAIVTHPDNTVSDLTEEQVMKIFDGTFTNWSEVGGTNEDIYIVAREEGSGTRAAFEEMVMGDALITDTAILQSSNGAVRTTVSGESNAIGFLSFGYLDATTKSINIGGVAATVENALNGTYPIVRPLLFITKGEPTGLIKEFIDYCLSLEGQKIVANDYIPVVN